MKYTSKLSAISAVAMLGMLVSQNVIAGDFKQANYDLKGSRSIPSKKEKGLTIQKIAAAGGLEVKWYVPLPGSPAGSAPGAFANGIPVTGAPSVRKGVVYAGTLSATGRKGGVDARDAETGAFKWHTEIPNGSGVAGTPLIHNGKLYVATWDGTIYLLKMKDGSILNSYKPNVSGPALDGIFSSPIAVPTEGGSLIVFAINPNDENPTVVGYGKSAIIALDSETLAEKWRYVITEGNEGGSGVAHAAPTYSAKNDMIYVATGQTINLATPGGISNTSNAVIALRAGVNLAPAYRLAWKTQVRNNDLWNFTQPFDPKNPRDTDVLDSPAVFKCASMNGECVAAGSKRGIFYVMDAKDGTILNGSGTDGIYARGLDAFRYSGNGLVPFADKTYGVDVVGNIIAGGYNLDSGYYRKDGNTIHFGTVLDGTSSLQSVSTCFQNSTFGTPCPGPDRSHIVLNSGDGLQEIGRYTKPGKFVYGALYLNDMILATAGKGFGSPNSLLVVDVTNPSSPTELYDVELAKVGFPSAISSGALISVSNCTIYMGTGFNVNSGGLYAIGLKGNPPCDKDDDDDDDDEND